MRMWIGKVFGPLWTGGSLCLGVTAGDLAAVDIRTFNGGPGPRAGGADGPASGIGIGDESEERKGTHVVPWGERAAAVRRHLRRELAYLGPLRIVPIGHPDIDAALKTSADYAGADYAEWLRLEPFDVIVACADSEQAARRMVLRRIARARSPVPVIVFPATRSQPTCAIRSAL